MSAYLIILILGKLSSGVYTVTHFMLAGTSKYKMIVITMVITIILVNWCFVGIDWFENLWTHIERWQNFHNHNVIMSNTIQTFSKREHCAVPSYLVCLKAKTKGQGLKPRPLVERSTSEACKPPSALISDKTLDRIQHLRRHLCSALPKHCRTGRAVLRT